MRFVGHEAGASPARRSSMQRTNKYGRPVSAEPVPTRPLGERALRNTPGRFVVDHGDEAIDMPAMRRYRLARVQEQLKKHGIPAIYLYDPLNIRYATGVRNMQAWTHHVRSRSCFVPAEGKATLFEYAGSEHLGERLDTVAEVRPAVARHFPPTGTADRFAGANKRWARMVADLMRERCGGDRRLAVDTHMDVFGGKALEAEGLALLPGLEIMGVAQAVKSPDEIKCMGVALSVAEAAVYRLQEAIEPGVTEIDLWAILEHVNIAEGGEHMECRLLSSGGRTNPWYQEASDRMVRPGDLIALDTDMVGPFGYEADISRTFFCGPGRPSGEQRKLYRIALEQLQHNLALVRPGASFRDMSERGYPLAEAYRQQQYVMAWHGVGMFGQWPTILAQGYFDENGYDGEVVPGMTLCVESYVGEAGGLFGVKLEEQVLVTETGCELLSAYPFEENLLGREL